MPVVGETTRSEIAAERAETPKHVVHRIPQLRCRKDAATIAEHTFEVQSKKSMRPIAHGEMQGGTCFAERKSLSPVTERLVVFMKATRR
ncbi:MAG: hypothetical protein DMG83_01080 [Acidobacteria bacterium]|nr:MAG: hypothetical protein DMG83_01080 [Acidobacteriota bacterium]